MTGQLDRTAMRLVRQILALVIVLSVAILPVAVSAAPAVSLAAQDPTEAAQPMMTSSEIPAMHDCCPDEADGQPCNHFTDQCPMAFCAAPPLSIAAPPVFQLDYPAVSANLLPIPVDQVVSLHSGSPPFRPPRV